MTAAGIAGHIRVGAVEEFEEGLVRAFRVGRDEVAVVRWRGAFYAFNNCCTHSAFSFTYLRLADDGSLACGAHGAVFDVATGRVLKGPAADDLPLYSVRLEGDEVYVRTRVP